MTCFRRLDACYGVECYRLCLRCSIYHGHPRRSWCDYCHAASVDSTHTPRKSLDRFNLLWKSSTIHRRLHHDWYKDVRLLDEELLVSALCLLHAGAVIGSIELVSASLQERFQCVAWPAPRLVCSDLHAYHACYGEVALLGRAFPWAPMLAIAHGLRRLFYSRLVRISRCRSARLHCRRHHSHALGETHI